MKMTGNIVALCLLAGVSQAAVIAYDDFATDGALDAQTGGSGFSDAWAGGSYTVASGVVTGQGTSFRTFSTPLASSGEFWMSFDLGFTSSSANSWGGVSFFVGGTERFYVGDTYQKGVWGLSNTSVRSETSESILQGMKTGVIKVTLGATSTVDLWVGANAVDPVDVSGLAVATSTVSNLQGIDQIRIGAGADIDLGDLILGDTFTDVQAIPEPATFGLLAAFGGGILFIRRRLMI